MFTYKSLQRYAYFLDYTNKKPKMFYYTYYCENLCNIIRKLLISVKY